VPISYDEEERIYHKGFRDGWRAAMSEAGHSMTDPLATDRMGGELFKATSKRKKTRKKDPKMARALEEANQKGRTKAGKLRKGWNQSRIMTLAHKLKRGM